MTDSIATRGAPAASTASRGRAMNIVLWVLQVLLAVQFAAAGFLKVSGAQAMVDLFADIGAGQWFRFLVGALEIAGAIGLLIPVLSGLAALCLAALMLCATATNLFIIDENPLPSIIFLLVSALIAWGRWSQITPLAGRLRR